MYFSTSSLILYRNDDYGPKISREDIQSKGLIENSQSQLSQARVDFHNAER